MCARAKKRRKHCAKARRNYAAAAARWKRPGRNCCSKPWRRRGRSSAACPMLRRRPPLWTVRCIMPWTSSMPWAALAVLERRRNPDICHPEWSKDTSRPIPGMALSSRVARNITLPRITIICMVSRRHHRHQPCITILITIIRHLHHRTITIMPGFHLL
jgi:hypothetical protein